jgi:RNA polymerase-binding transcription factor DksA
MKFGSYGACEDCKQAISPERLEARPTALRCAPCQARYEREHAGNEHHTI